MTGQKFGGRQVDDGVCNVFGCAYTGQRGAADEVGLPFGRVAGHGDGAGGDGVDADFRSQFSGKAFGQRDYAGFGNAVGDVAGPGEECADVGKVDDGAAGLLEQGSGGLGAEEGGFEVGVQRLAPLLFGGGREVGVDEVGGAVDEEIQAAEVVGDTGKEIVIAERLVRSAEMATARRPEASISATALRASDSDER